MADYVDLCVIRTDPDDPYRYLWMGESLEMKKEEILLPVRDSKPELLTVYRTEAGPVLTQVGEGEAHVVLKWMESGEDYTMDAFIRMNHADSAAEIIEAGRGLNLVSANLVAADKDGHIAWHATGKIPVRNGYSGFWPVFSDGENDLWKTLSPEKLSPYLYRVQKISSGDYFFRHHLASTLDNPDQEFRIRSFKAWQELKPVKVKVTRDNRILEFEDD